MEGPVLHSGAATWAPSGAAFYGHDAIPEFAGGYLVATLAGRHLKVVDLDPERDAVTGSREYLAGEYGRLRDIATDDNGNVYVLTSNRDGRGSPAGNDDRILRIVPVEGADHPDAGRDGGGGGFRRRIRGSGRTASRSGAGRRGRGLRRGARPGIQDVRRWHRLRETWERAGADQEGVGRGSSGVG